MTVKDLIDQLSNLPGNGTAQVALSRDPEGNMITILDEIGEIQTCINEDHQEIQAVILWPGYENLETDD